MSVEISTAFVQQYSANIMLMAQQKGSRLRAAVRNETLVGDKGFFDQIGATTATKRTTRHGDTKLVNSPHSRRRVTSSSFDWADLIDNEDRVRMLIDPSSAYVLNATSALLRSMDDEIIASALGTAYTGLDGTTAVALPAAQKIAVGGTAMTLAKLLAAKEILDANEVDEDEPRFCVATSKQLSDLLGDTKVTSSDYVTVKALVQGTLDTYLGFKFIRSERLPKDPAAATTRQCFAFSQQGLLIALAADVTARIAERADKNHAVQVFVSQDVGATRMDEKRVVQIDCLIP